MLLRNRAVQVKMVKTNDQDEPAEECNRVHLDPDKINEIIKAQVRNVAIAAVAVMGVATVLHTVSEIAINASKRKNDNNQ